jgi:hypothetical protein
MNRAEIEIPETWDTIKYEKPIFPTTSRGKYGSTLYNNNKYHCYSVLHIKPFYNLTPYRATGFGYAERNSKYIPLSHVVDRSKSSQKPPKLFNYKSTMRRIYEREIDRVKYNAEIRNENRERRERFEVEDRNIEQSYRTLVSKMHQEVYNLDNKASEMIGDARYRTHVINRLLRDSDDSMRP